MRVFKPVHKTKEGKRQQSKKWYVEVKDHRGTPRKYPGCSDKRLTAAVGSHIELLAACKQAGQPPDAQLCQWIQGIPDKLRERFVKVGLLDSRRAAAGKLLTEHLCDYRQSIGDNTKHARATHSALVRLFEACKFTFWNDVQASRFYNHLVRLKNRGDISQQTFNTHLKAGKAFARWMVLDRRVSESPFEHLKPIQITKREIRRRALTTSEVVRLLKKTKACPERFGMTGHERYLIYRLSVETGLRANEARTLTIGSFNFKNCTVTVDAAHSKRKRQDIIQLKPDSELIVELQEYFKGKMPNVRAFGGRYKQLTDRTSDMIQSDLADAQIPYIDDSGLRCDFHSLRHTTGTLLAEAGVHPRDAQEFMRHSDINLTMKFYTHVRRGAEIETAAKLPDLSPEKKRENEKAG